jgi:hypothetical protein
MKNEKNGKLTRSSIREQDKLAAMTFDDFAACSLRRANCDFGFR